ncbi:MAG: hypothetical protein JRG80_19255 [Deltaproteobacteria bacterium]|nr:hypothetical protein [Deltaproteobacteria bacterium]
MRAQAVAAPRHARTPPASSHRAAGRPARARLRAPRALLRASAGARRTRPVPARHLRVYHARRLRLRQGSGGPSRSLPSLRGSGSHTPRWPPWRAPSRRAARYRPCCPSPGTAGPRACGAAPPDPGARSRRCAGRARRIEASHARLRAPPPRPRATPRTACVWRAGPPALPGVSRSHCRAAAARAGVAGLRAPNSSLWATGRTKIGAESNAACSPSPRLSSALSRNRPGGCAKAGQPCPAERQVPGLPKRPAPGEPLLGPSGATRFRNGSCNSTGRMSFNDESERSRDGLGELERRARSRNGGQALSLKDWVALAEAWRIAQALRETRGNRSAAARALGIGRRTLYSKMAKLGLEPSWGVTGRRVDFVRRPLEVREERRG